jgi:hypothetical protein
MMQAVPIDLTVSAKQAPRLEPVEKCPICEGPKATRHSFPSKKGLHEAIAKTLLRLVSFRTSVSMAVRFISLSRSYLYQKSFDVSSLLPGRTGRILAMLEKALVFVGFRVGEEAIAVLVLNEAIDKTT